jgi:hypothetical protein
MADAAIVLDAEIRDIDLLDRLAASRGLVYDVVRRQCIEEQHRRDALAVMPNGARRRLETRHELEEKGGNARDNMRHIHSVLALCSLPYTRQPAHVREWNRTQGKMALSITAGKLASPTDGSWIEQPLPFGSRARLLLLHTCSEAIRQNSPTIEIEDTLTGFIRAMGFPVTGGKNGTLNSFKQQINALAACTMRIGMWDGTRARTVNTQPFTSLDVWMFPQSTEQRMLWPSTITFSQEFFQTLTKHAMPINIHAVKAFANSPRKLDMLFWLGYRFNGLNKPVPISWDALAEQWGANYSRVRNFRRDFALEIGELKEVFPKLPVQLTDYGCVIAPGTPEVIALPRKPMK